MKKQILMLVALSTIAVAGCAKTRAEGGTDGVTHWLAACESSAECGELECLCGLCTTACEDNAGCSELDASAQCMPPSDGSCTGPAQICQRPMTSMPIEDSGPGRTDGAVVHVDGGGGPIEDAGSSVDAGEPAACKRMDARSSGAFCGGVAGYAWDGLKCHEILCSCEGADCDKTYASAIDCDNATRACEPLTMCVENSDCVLRFAQCCQCSPVLTEDVHAVSSYQLDAHTERVCGGLDCEACATDPLVNARKRFVPTCGSATRWEGGECGVIDLARRPCTQEVGCRVRVARCCECGADPSIDELFATPIGESADEFFCEPGAGCCEAEPNYPENVTARCGSSGFCQLLLDGNVILPGNP